MDTEPDTPAATEALLTTEQRSAFSLAESIAALTEPGGVPRCGHCARVLAEVGLTLGDTFAIEHGRHHADEVTFTLSRSVARLLSAVLRGGGTL